MYLLRSSISLLTFLVCVCYGIAEVTNTTGGSSSTNATTTAATSPSAATTNLTSTATTATTTAATATTATTATTTTTTATTVAITATPPSTTTSTITSLTTITSTSGQGSFPLTTPANLTTQSSTTSSSTSDSTSITTESTSSSSISTNAPTMDVTSTTIGTTSSSKDTASSDTILPTTTTLGITSTSAAIASTQAPINNSTNSILPTDVVSPTSTFTPSTDALSSTQPSSSTLPPTSPSDMISTTSASTGSATTSTQAPTQSPPSTSSTVATSQMTTSATSSPQPGNTDSSPTTISTPAPTQSPPSTSSIVATSQMTTSATSSPQPVNTDTASPVTTTLANPTSSVVMTSTTTSTSANASSTILPPTPAATTPITSSTTITVPPTATTNVTTSTPTKTTTDKDDCASHPCQHGASCQDQVNNYTCSCVAGYTGVTCETDINECAGNACKNGGTCIDRINNYTCTCAPGWEGQSCDKDINDCASNPCQYGATCQDQTNGFTCSCVAGYTGVRCETNVNECANNPCKNQGTCIDSVNNYTCTCAPGWDGWNCDNNIDDCATYPCKNGSTCNDGINNYTCTCASGYEGRNCNISINECERKTHTCSEYADCVDTDGSYNCSCRSGFSGDGFNCTNINECAAENETCVNGDCIDVPGTYRCFCHPGWTGNNCTQDIDECSTGKPCSTNANCNNTEGDYTCKCHSGYRGDGHECVFDVLIAVPSSSPRRYGDDNTYGPFIIKDGLAYFGQFYDTFFVSVNGYITLGRSLSRTYPPTTSENWPRMPVIAPLWADVQMGPDQGSDSFIEISDNITDTNVLNAISAAANISSKLTKAIAVTWRGAVPYPYSRNFKHETADFQVIVATDNEQTFVVYNYDQKLFNWTTSFGRHVAIGYSKEDFRGDVMFTTETFTNVNKQSNIGVNGRWRFNVTSSAADSKLKCYNAINSISIKALDTIRALSEPCPCSYDQAIRDRRFRPLTYAMYKFESRFQQKIVGNTVRQQCQYSRFGSLMIGYSDGGYLDITNSTDFNALHTACCTNSPSNCQNLFYNVHPSDTCIGYRPPSSAPAWGDPHIKTLDGAEYTFNGRGEYILVKSHKSFEVQVRTDNINDNTDASIFVGLALRNGPSDDIISIVLNTSNKYADIYINEKLNATVNATTVLNIVAKGFEMYSDVNSSGALYIDLESQLSLKVTIRDTLDIVATMPKSNNTQGLLGNNDGNKHNDYIKRDGQKLYINATEEELYAFGTSWRISASESLFNATYDAKSFDFFNNNAIKPLQFISDSLKNESKMQEYFAKCSGKVNYTDARVMCNNNTACLVDTAASCDISFGNNTRNTDVVETEAAFLLQNYPPVIEIVGNNVSNILYITNGNDFHLTLNVTDDQDLHVNAKLDTNGTFEQDSSSFKMTKELVKIIRNQTIFLKFNASDSMGAYTELQPIIYYCGCNDSLQCNYEFILENGKVSDKFYRAKCNCSDGVTDQYCDQRVSKCDICYNNVSCTNGTCGSCPPGLSGDGIKCNDVNECFDDPKPCVQLCDNTLGSYKCSCVNGYQYKNNTLCEDINECILQKDNCTASQMCVNTIGSFICKCRPGYANINGSCSEERYSRVFGGKVYFTVYTKFATDDSVKEDVEMYLQHIFGALNASVEVTLADVLSGRKRRSTDMTSSMEAGYILLIFNDSITYKTVQGLWSGRKDDVLLKPLRVIVGVDTNKSLLFSEENEGTCVIPGFSNCDPSTTNCKYNSGKPMCECKEGFQGYNLFLHSCKDINECDRKNEVCDKGNCSNTLGSYTCTCQPGFQYDGIHQCTDLCEPSPCKNDGQCIHGEQENQYICKCTDNWTGQKCDEENQETKKLKTIAIAVGSVFGAGCLLLLCVVFGMYRRNKAISGDFYTRRPLSVDFDDDSRYDLRPTSIPLRKQDFPIDDDTSPAFNIPRPAVSTTNAYDPVGQKSAYDLLEEQEASKYTYNALSNRGTFMVAETKPLTEERMLEGEDLGKENPSFLHSEASASSKRRASKSPYEYF